MRLAIAALALVGCGGLSHQVDRDLLKDITIENKLLLFDAENDVSIALDDREQIARRVRELRGDIRDAEAQIREAESDRDRALTKNDAKRADLAAKAKVIFEQKIDYLEASIDLLHDKLSVQEKVVVVAEAKFELAKAKLVKRNNVFGASRIEIADFEAQVDEAVAAAREAQQSLSEGEKAVASMREGWEKAREQLAKESGGGVGSPWAEDSAAWGNW
jgi:chromosome segregation ATPase